MLKALLGQTVTLPCVVQGEPSPEISWFHNGHLVRVEDSSALRIKHAALADQGTYRCVAKNNAGEDTLEVTLEVLSEYFSAAQFGHTDPYTSNPYTRTCGKHSNEPCPC